MSDLQQHPSDEAWEHRLKRPWSALRNGVLVLLAIDLILTLVTAVPLDPTLSIRSRDDVRHVLHRAVDQDAWVLVGDSVLAGDVLAPTHEDWQQERVLDHLRRESGDGAPSFEQVALNGVGLADVLGVIAELDHIDPEGSVPVVIEVNPRFFSRRNPGGCAHPWLCGRAEAGPWDGFWLEVRDGLDGLEPWLPVLRHRRALVADLDPTSWLAKPAAEGPDGAEGRARILPHYLDLALGKRSALGTLDAIQARLDATGRRAIFFSTPLNDAFFGEQLGPTQRGRVSAAVAEHVPLVELDHPLFRPEHFVDHCHLTPDGNRLLALNLLHELNEPMRAAPHRAEIVRPIDPDQTLVGNQRPGFVDGPSWTARFAQPRDLALSASGRIAIADTANGAVRVLDPPYQTVRTLLEVDEPVAVAFLGDELYVASEGGSHLARLREGTLETVLRRAPNQRLVELEAHGDRLFAREGKRALLEIGRDGTATVLLQAQGSRAITAFEVAEPGVFVADESGRILHFQPGARRVLAPGTPAPKGITVAFANRGRPVVPEPVDLGNRPFFPRPFDKTKVDEIVGLDWVDRYGGLLVRSHRARPGLRLPEPGREQWRFFDLEKRQVYPWIRPRPFGGSHLMWDVQAKDWASPYGRGSVVVHQPTAATFHLEQGRSRLVRREDGLLGTARIGHAGTGLVMSGSQERFGDRAGQMASERFQPARFLGELGGPHELDGPYTVLVGGSSMMAMSDNVGMYSLARVLEERLRHELGYRDRTAIQLFQRVKPSGGFPAVVQMVEAAADTVKPDVIVVGMWEPPGTANKRPDEAAFDRTRQRLVDLKHRWNAEVFVLDSIPLHRLRAAPSFLVERQEELRRSGIHVLALGDQLVDGHTRTSPWGIPPFKSRHASPWSIEAAADAMAAAMAPAIRSHLRDRVPGWQSGPRGDDGGVGFASIRPQLADLDTSALPPIEIGQVVTERDGTTLHLLIDLGRNPFPDATFEQAALAASLVVLETDPSTDRMHHLHIRLVEFERYDEYGQGAAQGAVTKFERTVGPEELLTLSPL